MKNFNIPTTQKVDLWVMPNGETSLVLTIVESRMYLDKFSFLFTTHAFQKVCCYTRDDLPNKKDVDLC